MSDKALQPDYDLTSQAAMVAPTREPVKTSDPATRETDRVQASVGACRRARILGRLDPVLATVIRWADEDTAAMRRLLEDADLRARLNEALIESEDRLGQRD